MDDRRPLLVLWDIDHTLIDTGGVGGRCAADAFEAVTGRRLVHPVDPTGRTEPAIFAETLRRHGIEPSEQLQGRYAAELPWQYERRALELRTRGRVLPGARAALAAMAVEPGVVQAVLTGNLRAVAVLKLAAYGLESFVDWEVGGYGDDAVRRPALVRVAQARAGTKWTVHFDRTNTTVVGDSIGDVQAGRDGGAAVVAVASGRDRAGELLAAGADRVLPSLLDVETLRRVLLGFRPRR